MTASWSAPEGLAVPAGPYSPASATADGWVHTAGLVSMDDGGQVIGTGDVRAQTHEIFRQADAIFAAAGCGLGDVVFAHVFVADMADYAVMNEVYREMFAGRGLPFPPRYCIRADLVKPELLVEIAFVAKSRS